MRLAKSLAWDSAQLVVQVGPEGPQSEGVDLWWWGHCGCLKNNMKWFASLNCSFCWDAVLDVKWINSRDGDIRTQIQIWLCKPISVYRVRQQQQRWSHLTSNRNTLKFIAFICKLTDHVPCCVKCEFFFFFWFNVQS